MGFSSSQMASAALSAQIGGGLMGAVGNYYSARGAQTSLEAQARSDDINAKIAEQAAQNALAAGQREEQTSRLKAAQLKSTQRVAFAANGLDLGSDTATNVLTSTDTLAEIDADTIAANAVRNAWGYRTQATNYKNDALMKRATAGGINPMTSAATSLLGSAGAVAGQWYSLNKSGALDELKANMTDDPIYALGKKRGWFKE